MTINAPTSWQWTLERSPVTSWTDGSAHVAVRGAFDPEPANWPSTAGAAVVWTSDDAESRVLHDLPTPLASLLATSPWMVGSAIRLPSTFPTLTPCTLTDLVRTVQQIGWKVATHPHRRASRPALVPQPWTPTPNELLDAWQSWRATAAVVDPVELIALEAGLRQFWDDLDGSHQAAQSIEGAGRHHGDYWHALMHRREPDYGNAKYWFRQVGRHAIFSGLAAEAERIAQQFGNATFHSWLPRLIPAGTWDPFTFVDCVAAAANHAEDDFRRAVEELQYRELLLLFAQTCRDAV